MHASDAVHLAPSNERRKLAPHARLGCCAQLPRNNRVPCQSQAEAGAAISGPCRRGD